MDNYDGQGKSRDQEAYDSMAMLVYVTGMFVTVVAGVVWFVFIR